MKQYKEWKLECWNINNKMSLLGNNKEFNKNKTKLLQNNGLMSIIKKKKSNKQLHFNNKYKRDRN